jgi:hypothetical protein
VALLRSRSSDRHGHHTDPPAVPKMAA